MKFSESGLTYQRYLRESDSEITLFLESKGVKKNWLIGCPRTFKMLKGCPKYLHPANPFRIFQLIDPFEVKRVIIGNTPSVGYTGLAFENSPWHCNLLKGYYEKGEPCPMEDFIKNGLMVFNRVWAYEKKFSDQAEFWSEFSESLVDEMLAIKPYTIYHFHKDCSSLSVNRVKWENRATILCQ